MSNEKQGTPSKLSKILSGSFTTAQEREKFISERNALLTNDAVTTLVGFIAEAGSPNDGTFFVQFVSGTSGWATAWPQWAYEIARDALLHGKQIMVTYSGSAPYGSNIVGAYIVNTPA